ncbi:hypothetical protein JDV02_005924 [Purpureocillium takamizusanense]|uniref:AGC-kinase C-terminal domain-containing protein n=1 Tax=Purpureocillium takamizusanense TaxID=2060973 RepID=A0A9Q8QHI9_9HYPO|nr:uncharacterized protein JDV02_005924 [Purpureocillium takamizusanense]UNI19765.1 hypothetical protein JDV02_005924 [Purpureocillium takamizusanense]
MLSHLRFHRRGASNPASPLTDQPQSLSPLGSHDSPLAPDSASPSDARPPSSSSSAFPPVLPPITRVTSADADLQPERRGPDSPAAMESRPQQGLRSPYNGDSGFIGGVALQNYRRDVEAHKYARSGSIDLSHNEDHARRQRPTAVSTGTDGGTSKFYAKSMSTFSTPLDLQNSAPPGVGRRPAGARLNNDVQLASSAAANPEPQKGKKGLPFLKNPMSTLLMRRKNNQNVPDVRPLPLSGPRDEPIYDPRIKGTRVHDFSAPRRKQHAPGHSLMTARSGSQTDLSTNKGQPLEGKGSRVLEARQPRQTSNASESARSEPAASTASQLLSRSSVSSQPSRAPSVEQKLATPEGKPAPPVPPKDDIQAPSRSASTTSPPVPDDPDTQQTPKPAMSQRTTRSRNISLSEISAVPRHMKSTSSRFSFDMVGAAKQEKLLEERHRQRELERKATEADDPRDSRFDDFDEDSFDYDAMMDDDGLEERIPGVNADFDDDEEVYDESDPDNDQDNFAGFVFQRSNPTSSLGSPQSNGMLNTPRDAEGKAIGFAMTKDTPSLATFPLSPSLRLPLSDQSPTSQASGLGIQDAVESKPVGSPEPVQGDDLYFDDGMIGLEDEFAEDLAATPEYDAAPFDESIFDNNDTDQFGRPVPGAFVQAQSQRCTAPPGPSAKRESDITSRLSAHSGTSHSTAHTSLSADVRKERATAAEPSGHFYDEQEADPAQEPGLDGGISRDPVAAYQAELAAAAHKAAASGKFQRSASPYQNGDYDEDDYESNQVHQDDAVHQDIDEGDYDQGFVNMDDFELDDDGIIAEANASALANDSDGWYGQEFGFYSAPSGQLHGSQGSGPSESSGYEYANGGFFGPKGMSGLDRSTSGRMVSREPNLTPITERSEYSNRNSLMSMGFPPLSSSTPVVQSPGLAQLAMMADSSDDQMTLSALLRLRSKAWGGSQVSLVSSKEGSPRSDRGDIPSSPWGLNSATAPPGPNGGHIRKSSTFSTLSRDSDAPSGSASPTLTMANVTSASPFPAPQGIERPVSIPESGMSYTLAGFERHDPGTGMELSETALSPVSERNSMDAGWGLDGRTASASSRLSGRGHHRHKSSADSVSYLKEEGSGETRWVMERRRTGESGEVEILQREVVEGGRI